MKKNVYSVGQVNSYIKNMFAQDFFLGDISVKGEVSNCKYHSSGHIYFTLKDASGTISAVLYSFNRQKGLAFRMKEGDKVVVTGKVDVFERDGKYQLKAQKIELDGEGNLYLRYEALKRELEEMGMFAPEYKKPIPKYAMRIGIVTAQTGAAIQDICNITARRNPYVQLILYPALVQGDGAALSIVNGIRALDAMNLDVMIVGRGGGSIEDMWAFNEEIVARAIFDCETPVISAVGHETDTTIADLVADLRAPTPSAAAELAVFDYKQFQDTLAAYGQRMRRITEQKLSMERMRAEQYRLHLAKLSPENRLRDNRKSLAQFEERLHQRMAAIMTDKRHKLALLAGNLEAHSPAKKLSSGYSYVQTKDGRTLTDASDVKTGDEVKIHLYHGRLTAAVTEVFYE